MKKIHCHWIKLIFVATSWFSCSVSAAGMPIALQSQLDSLLPEKARQALLLIPDPDRKLLAAQGYLHAGSHLESRWSWSDAEIKAFEGSPAQAELLADIERVNATFRAANPGYRLYFNPKVRSLDTQIAHWNSNASVALAASQLWRQFEKSAWFTDESEKLIATQGLKTWLLTTRTETKSNLATPGLSLHGRMHAIDFQIQNDKMQLIAEADSKQIETVWKAQDWAERLKRAIDSAGPRFHGPLTAPDEPWHYNYTVEGVSP